MQVDLWVAALRILAVVLAVSVLWPNLLQPWRWPRRATKDPAGRRHADSNTAL